VERLLKVEVLVYFLRRHADKAAGCEAPLGLLDVGAGYDLAQTGARP